MERKSTAVATARRRIVAAAAAVATVVAGLVITTGAAAPAAAATAGTLVGGFEDPSENWFAVGDAGTFSRVQAADAPQGQHVANVLLTNTSAGLVEVARGLPNLQFGKLTFALKAPDLSRIVVRLTDSTGRTQQTGHVLQNIPGWQTVTVDDPNVGDPHYAWGGTDGANFQGTAVQMSILVDTGFLNDPRPAQTTIQFDDVRISPPVQPTTLALDQTTLGNVFVGAAPARVGYRTTGDLLRWTLRDTSGAVTGSGELANPGTQGTLSLNVDPGWYSLSVDALSSGSVIATANTTLARIPQQSASPGSRFGVAAHYSPGWWNTDSVPLVGAAGLGTVRDEIQWADLEKQPGVYDWSAAVGTGQEVNAGLDLLLIAGYGNPLYDGGAKPTSPQGLAAYAAYSAALAARYQNNSAGIELWNEYDLGTGNTQPGTADDYVAMLKQAAPAIRQAAPGLPILGPGVADLTSGYLERTFQLGALDYLDGIVLHPYSYPTSAEALDATLTRIDALVEKYNNGRSKPIWITEDGWPTGTNTRAVSGADQATNLTKSAAIAAAHGVARFFWYDFQNDGTDATNVEDNFGLVHSVDDTLGAYTPKAAYVACATATSQLRNASFVGRDQSIGSVWNLQYSTTGGTDPDLRVLWATQNQTVGIRSTQPITVTTQFGTTSQYPGGGTVVLPLTNEPVYVSGHVDAVVTDSSALTVDQPYVGQPTTAHWTVDNTGSGVDQTFTLAIDGQSTPVTQQVAARKTGTVAVTLDAPTATGPMRVTGHLDVGGAPRGILTTVSTVQDPLALTGDHAVDASGQDVLRLRLTNHAPGPFTVQGIDWAAGPASGTTAAGQQVAGTSTLIVDVPVASPATPTTWTATARVSSHGNLTATGALRAASDITTVPERPIVVDGHLENLGGQTPIELSRATGGLDAKVWYTWDPDFLYVSAAVADPVQYQPWTGPDVWQGDSIQLTFAAGAPGEDTRTYHEIGLSLTPAGPQMYQWLPSDKGGVLAGRVVVVRDAATSTTTYEAAIPWSSLGGWNPSDALFSSSIAINDNDGSGRSYVEWGGGIVESKDATRFRSLRLVAAPTWTSSTAYTTGDLVTYNGAVFKASWWTKAQTPGDPYGAWQQLANAADGTPLWTASRVFVAGDVVSSGGKHYVAKWWTRNQQPGASQYGPWQLTS
jgi:hypothetical protein